MVWTAEQKKSSSGNSGERRTDLENEAGVVAVTVGHALEDLDLVVDPLEDASVQREVAVREDARQPGLEVPREGHEPGMRLQVAQPYHSSQAWRAAPTYL